MTPIKIKSAPGIKRDGTRFEGDSYIDGNWTRFQRGIPRKIGGYTSRSDALPGLTRGMGANSRFGSDTIHSGTNDMVVRTFAVPTGFNGVANDRTPAGLVASSENLWQFDHYFDPVAASVRVVAHVAQNLIRIDNHIGGKIYQGEAHNAVAPLVDTGLPEVSGGIVAIGVYLFSYGSNGLISWTNPNTLGTPTNEAHITPQKIIKGLPLRGGGAGPAGLFWSIDSLIRGNFVGGSTVWAFDTISSRISVLSSQAIIEYDGVYYWPGTDRFLMFNGTVREVPNTYNQEWFYENLNFSERQKVFVVAVPRFGEIWWCFPKGAATECNHAVVYNVREGYWYDTELPDDGRSGGQYSQALGRPIMAGNLDPILNKYILWDHETDVDRIDVTLNPTTFTRRPIAAHYETSEISMLTAEEAQDKSLRVARVEPDFIQSGDMELTVKGRANAKATVIEDAPKTIKETPAEPADETIKLRSIKRLMSFKFSSNVLGGNFEAGETIAHIEPADGRVES